MTRFSPLRAALLAAALLASPVRAQELLHTLQYPIAGDFGHAVAGVPDADGDGAGDLLVGGGAEVGGARVYLFSGATGALLHTLEAPVGGDFGRAVGGVPDADGDGRGDLLAAGTEGQAHLYSGATGALLHTLTSPFSGAGFGTSVSGMPDVDGDGRGDLLVGAPFESSGQVYLYSGATGALLSPIQSPNPENGSFGYAVSGVADADGDERGDLLVGASGESPERVYLFSGASGALLHALTSLNPGGSGFGSSVAGVTDVDGDGRGDLLVGATFESPGTSPDYAGRAYLFSGATGAPLFEIRSPNEEFGGNFGTAVALVRLEAGTFVQTQRVAVVR